MSDPFLFGTVVVGYDRTPRGEAALRLGELLAASGGTRLSVVSVHDRNDGPGSSLEKEIASRLPSPRVPVSSHGIEGASPARVLHEVVSADPQVGLLVLGSTHHAVVAGASPRSVAAKLMGGSPCPVAIAPRELTRADEIRVIAVAFDDTAESQEALALARELGLRCGATLWVIAVGHPGRSLTASAATTAPIPAVASGFDLQERLHAVVAELPGKLRALPVYERGNPARAILERVGAGVDLLVMGSRGYGPLRSVLLGSVSAEVVGAAACPVLVAPRGLEVPRPTP